jgi:hypothetical protein
VQAAGFARSPDGLHVVMPGMTQGKPHSETVMASGMVAAAGLVKSQTVALPFHQRMRPGRPAASFTAGRATRCSSGNQC